MLERQARRKRPESGVLIHPCICRMRPRVLAFALVSVVAFLLSYHELLLGPSLSTFSEIETTLTVLRNDRHAFPLTVKNATEAFNQKVVTEENRITLSSSSSSPPSKNLLDQVIHLISPPDKAKEYLSKYPGKDFRFYVYDTLSRPYTWQGVSAIRENERRCLGSMTHKAFVATYCDWTSICNPLNHTRDCQYSNGRHNRNGDAVLSRVLAEYKGPMRTYNPWEAQLFIVPFPWGSHDFISARQRRINLLSVEEFQKEIMSKLTFFNSSTAGSHLFLYSNHGTNKAIFNPLPLVASMGQRSRESHIVIPYVNTHFEYQPPSLLARDEQLDLFYASKKYSIGAAMAQKISGNSWVRQEFFSKADEMFGGSLGGLPVNITNIQEKRKLPNELEVMSLYRQSVFCPCFRGDTPGQKRFFDTILSGCIPVVMAYKWSGKSGENFTSYFVSKGMPLEQYLPFAKGSFAGAPGIGIDYSDIVVEVDGDCGIPCLKPTLENLINNKSKLRLKQAKLAEYAKLFAFGMQENSFKLVDAVAAILVQARHSSMTLSSKVSNDFF